MRKQIKIATWVGMLIIGMCSLSACGHKVADEEQVRQELETNSQFRFLGEDEQIEEVVIEKRQTDKEQKTDTVWCMVTTSDAEASCQKEVVLTYGLYDKTGWVLDDMDVASRDKWVMTPLKGVAESELPDLLSGQTLVIEDEEWLMTQDSLINTKIEEQQTDLEQKTDQVTVSFVLDDKLERAEGKIEVGFAFDQEWKFDSVISMGDFSVSMKEEYVLHVSDDDLISKVMEQELPIGKTKQTVPVEKAEISDFRVAEQKTESKGSRQIYECSYKVNQFGSVLEAASEIIYTYQEGDGWNGSVKQTTSDIISSDIAGDWAGTYVYISKRNAKLHISEIEDDGTVAAVYSFDEGSYALSGTWDQKSLELQLEAGDWIEKPDKIRFHNDKDNMTGELVLEKERLEVNTGQGLIYFTKNGE